ncbi:hypothetical protein HK107_03780 [Parvularcula sp. ZS-1/3]|uniref:Uncharacterized protein n=1 Tax=Parvularcula mediterranea TaxID=2732508 RepID=A0A7Y3RKZ4_9PROT|nr:hypothetical protein [Parvularcula mediterranea]NNU15446.1 hypothetical protein [Parvularcula mediterranea]
MLLARFREALKEQNWAMVAVELGIVAFGVFLGVQFGNWNEARAERQREAVLLEKLRMDFETIEETMIAQKARSEGFLELVIELRQFIESDVPLNQRDLDDHLNAMVSASRPARPSPTYVEMQASGALSRLDNPELRAALVAYHLDTEVADRGLDWALEGFSPERTTLRYVSPLNNDYSGLRDAVGEVNYMIVAHQLQVRYADASIELARQVLSEIEEGER